MTYLPSLEPEVAEPVVPPAQSPDAIEATPGSIVAPESEPDEELVAAVESRASTLLDAVDLLLAETGDQP